MKRLAVFVSCSAFIALSGRAFAQQDKGGPALEALIASAGAQLAPAMSGSLEQYQPVAVPAPAAPRAAGVPHKIALLDITEKCTEQGEVVSAYPGIYKLVPSEENSRIIRVFSFKDPKGGERRIEVYYTGGDWMQYGLVYLVTNAGRSKDRVRAYFASDLSTPDREVGGIAPKINPFNTKQLTDFIAADFLDAGGNVKSAFSSVAEASASAK